MKSLENFANGVIFQVPPINGLGLLLQTLRAPLELDYSRIGERARAGEVLVQDALRVREAMASNGSYLRDRGAGLRQHRDRSAAQVVEVQIGDTGRLRGFLPAKQARSWAVHLIRKRGEFLGTVKAPDKEAAEQAAVEHFQLTAQQRKRLVLTEMR